MSVSKTTPLFAPAPAGLLAVRPLTQWVFFFIVALALIVASWNVIGSAGFELGDFAANSLLIQDGKSLALLKGNYSRVGFNHPGPAILYVLTAGEVLLHDWLHVAPSPMSGQLMAVALYTSLWLTLMLRMLGRMTGATGTALLAVTVFAFAAALLDFQVFTGAWFPHLYFFPFAVMLLAAGRLLDGHADSLPSLALACGFLINGHVSFMAILGIIFLTVVASNYVLVRRGSIAGPALLSRQFLALHRRPLVRAVLILAVFLLPLLIETALHFPGPLAEYASFSKHAKHNTLAQAFTYMSVYWGGSRFALCLAAAFCATLAFAGAALRTAEGNGVRALVLVFVGATAALVFYAKVGIDLLDHTYIGLFYYTVPALALTLAVVLAGQASVLRDRAPVIAVIVLLLGAFVLRDVHKPVDYMPQFSQPGVPQLYNSLKAIPHQGRMVLDLDHGKDPGFVWSSVLGLQAYAKRRPEDFFCIHNNWHISNTKAARCTEAELAGNPRYRIWQKLPTDGVVLAEGMGLAVERLLVPDMATLGVVTVKDKPTLFQEFVLGTGWSTVEPEIVWTTGKQSQLAFHTRPGLTGFVTVELEAFLPKPDANQVLRMGAVGKPPQTVTFTQAAARQHVRLPVTANGDGSIVVNLQIDHPVSPKQAGLSPDARELGVALRNFVIEDH